MKTAHEILQEAFLPTQIKNLKKDSTYDVLVRSINNARIEAINECAMAAKTKDEYVPAAQNEWQTIVDTESIISLIKKVK